jgi:acyl-CoA dehydrogenase
MLDSGPDEGLDVVGLSHIALHRQGKVVAQLLRRRRGRLQIDVTEHYPRTLGDESLRDRKAQSLCSTRDYRGLTAQQRHLDHASLAVKVLARGHPSFEYHISYRICLEPGVHIPNEERLPMTTAEVPEVSDEDFQEILAQTRHFVRTAVIPREQEILDDDRVPDDLRDHAKKMGLFGYAIPQRWGGLGLNLVQDVELAMELGYTSLALRSMFGTNNGIAGQVLVGFGTDEQKARWLEPMACGDVVASFALTEPGAGSNPAGLRTKAVRDKDDWVISGQKRFITNAPVAGLFVVFARTRPADDQGPGIAVFLVPADAAGVEVGAKDAKMGQEGAWTADVSFTDVRISPGALIGGSEDIGYRAAMTSLARGRVHIAALAVGAAQRALDESVAYAATATQGGTPIGSFQ